MMTFFSTCLITGLLSMKVYGFNYCVNKIRNKSERIVGCVYGRKSTLDKHSYDFSDCNNNGNGKKSTRVKQIKNSAGDASPKTKNQRTYVSYLSDPNVGIVVCDGTAGSGKTFLACSYAVNKLKTGSISKIVMTRPTVTVENENIGFLPGTMELKMDPYVRPLIDVLDIYFDKSEIEHMFNDGVLEIVPLGFMRGRTFSDSVIIADEMQNSTPEQMLMLVTRIGENSKMIITGDNKQSDIKNGKNGLTDFIYKIDAYGKNNIIGGNDNPGSVDDVNNIKVVIMEDSDVVRSGMVKSVLKIFEYRVEPTELQKNTEEEHINIESENDYVVDIPNTDMSSADKPMTRFDNDCAIIPLSEISIYERVFKKEDWY